MVDLKAINRAEFLSITDALSLPVMKQGICCKTSVTALGRLGDGQQLGLY